MSEENEAGAVASGKALSEALENRASSYRMFSRLFLKPLSEEEIDALAGMDMVAAAQSLGGEGLLAEGFNDMGRGLHRRHTGTKRLLSTDFTMCFDGVSALNDLVAVPYASVFVGSKKGNKAELYQEPRNADRKMYRSEHVEADPDLNLPDDHLSFELSFMADLSDKTADALAKGDRQEALRLVGVSREFLTGHILSWYGLFYDLAAKIVETRFYRGVLKATYGYLQSDGGTLDEIEKLIGEDAQG